MSRASPAAPSTSKGVTRTSQLVYRRGSEPIRRDDRVVVEEPLELRLDGETLAVTMRTPGHDHELCAGYLLSEGLVKSASDLTAIRHCRQREDEALNVIDAVLAPGVAIDVAGMLEGRGTHFRSSSCGVCGRAQIEDLMTRLEPLDRGQNLARELVHDKIEELRGAQPIFDLTGGCHGAGVIDHAGNWLVVREDVGRHNAVDKAVGRLWLDDALPGTCAALLVSGRISFEIVQKALSARIAVVVGVSAPSSLAIAVARSADMTLVGFARDAGFNAYSGEYRLA